MGANYSLPPFEQQLYVPPTPIFEATGPEGKLTWANIQQFLSGDAQRMLESKSERHIGRVIHWLGTICYFDHSQNIIGMKMNPSLSNDANLPDVFVKMPIPTEQFAQFMERQIDFTGSITSIQKGVATVEYLYYQYGSPMVSACEPVGNLAKLGQDLTPQPLSYQEFIKDASPIIISTIFESLVGKDVAFTSEIVKIVGRESLQAKLHLPICSPQTGYDITANCDSNCDFPATLNIGSVCTLFGKLDSMEQNGAIVMLCTSILHHNTPNVSIENLSTEGGKISWDASAQHIRTVLQYGNAVNACLARMRGQEIATPVSRGVTPPRVMPGEKSITPPKIKSVTPPKIGGSVTPSKIGMPSASPAVVNAGIPAIQPVEEPVYSESALVSQQVESAPAASNKAETRELEPEAEPEEPLAQEEEQEEEHQQEPDEEDRIIDSEPKFGSIYDEATGKVKLDEPESEFKGKDPLEVAAILMRDAPKTAYAETAISTNLFSIEEDDALSRLKLLKQTGVFNHFEEAADEHLSALGTFTSKPAGQQGDDYYGGTDYYNDNAQNDYYGQTTQNDYYGNNETDYYQSADGESGNYYSGQDYNSTQGTYGSDYNYNGTGTENYDYSGQNYGGYDSYGNANEGNGEYNGNEDGNNGW